MLANLSRRAIGAARARFDPCMTLVVTAPVEVLARPLSARGREDERSIADRLARAGFAVPQGADVAAIDDGGSLAAGLGAFLAALPPQPVRA